MLREFWLAALAEYVFSPRRAAAPAVSPGACDTAVTYGRAVARACRKAGAWVWSPNQLRHAAATAVRRGYGLEAAQAVLGRARADVTQGSAGRDLGLAVRVAAEAG